MISIDALKSWYVIILGLTISTVFGLVVIAPLVYADEQPFDFTYCSCVTIKKISATKQLTVFSYEAQGIVFSNHENKAFDNCTYDFGGIGQVVAGKRLSEGYVKYQDPNGDMVIGKFTVVGKDKTLEFLQGTGKWKGITGGGKGRAITRGKPIKPGTYQGCSRIKGTFKLPK